MNQIYFGVDIGGTAMKHGVFTPAGEMLDKWEVPTPLEEHGSRILPTVAQEIRRCCGENGYDMAQVSGVGLGIPGPVRRDGVVERCVNLGLGGEIGHIIVDPSEPEMCSCGHYGCLNQIASATGIVTRARRLLSASDAPSVLRAAEKFTCKDVFDAAKAGDALAVQAVENCLSFLGKSISDASYTVDPDAFILGGGVAKAGQYLADVTYKYYSDMAKLGDGRAQIVLARLGNDAGIWGAAKLAMDCAAH